MSNASETDFRELAGVEVRYDRAPNAGYGTDGIAHDFRCTQKLRDTLDRCFDDLWPSWGHGSPRLILSAGTLGDGENAHGKGLAFDLDGFKLADDRFMMDEYPQKRLLYVGVNAHLFLYFTQILSYHYQGHKDHFHVDFNNSNRFNTASNAQTFFLQSALRYVFEADLGEFGLENDGVDGLYGDQTRQATRRVLADEGLSGQGGLTTPEVWNQFLALTRDRCFSG